MTDMEDAEPTREFDQTASSSLIEILKRRSWQLNRRMPAFRNCSPRFVSIFSKLNAPNWQESAWG